MDKAAVKQALKQIREIKGDNLFYDLHAHPFEMMYEHFDYQPSTERKGLFSAGSSAYVKPAPSTIKLEQIGPPVAARLMKKFNLLNARRCYAHTGPKAFYDEMDLCAIDRVLLLSVMDTVESGDSQLKLLNEMFGDDEKFTFAYCLPNDIPNHLVAEEVKRVVGEYPVKALKIHPGVTGIDTSQREGVDRIEAILDASRQCELKVVIHGGRSPDCKNSQAVSYGTAENLQYVDWAITPESVVIAHGGLFGHSLEDARENVAPVMVKLLERYGNLIVDTSGVGYDLICLMLEHYDLDKIIFGSDALYIKQWMAMVQLWTALQTTLKDKEGALLRIASTNPSRVLGLH